MIASTAVGMISRPTGLPSWQPYVDAALVSIRNLSTLDYRTIEEDRRRLYDGATREFAMNVGAGYRYTDQYAIQDQEVSTGEPTGAGLVAVGEDIAIVLVANTVTITREGSPEPTVRYNRNLVTIVRVDGDYKLDDCKAVW